jgi:hypothetical protein
MKAKKQTPAQGRPSSNLPSNVDKGLLQYAAAAGAAGVGLLALAPTAEAKVIYTPTNVPITVNGPYVPIDLNNDGIIDFYIYNVVASGGARSPRPNDPNGRSPLGFYAHALIVTPTQPTNPANEVGAITSFTKNPCAAEVLQGHKITANKNFVPGALDLFGVAGDYTSPGTMSCPWQGKGNKGGFLALKFVINGNTHFGWARVTLGGTVPALTGYAYEDVPNAGIKAGVIQGPDESADASEPSSTPVPQPASLGALAKGASGLPIWRAGLN